jgi:hypothetical protein
MEADVEENKVRFVVYITPEQRAALEKLHVKSGAPISEILRRFITAGLKKEGK